MTAAHIVDGCKHRTGKHGICRHEYQVRAHEFCLRGEALPTAKLTDDAVRKIRREIGAKTRQQLADELGVSRSAIDRVLYGNGWRHVRDAGRAAA